MTGKYILNKAGKRGERRSKPAESIEKLSHGADDGANILVKIITPPLVAFWIKPVGTLRFLRVWCFLCHASDYAQGIMRRTSLNVATL